MLKYYRRKREENELERLDFLKRYFKYKNKGEGIVKGIEEQITFCKCLDWKTYEKFRKY